MSNPVLWVFSARKYAIIFEKKTFSFILSTQIFDFWFILYYAFMLSKVLVADFWVNDWF